MNIWTDCPKTPLPELLSFVVDNRGKTVPVSDKGNHILIATNCVRNENLYPSYEKIRWLSQDTYDNWFRAHPLPGDILFVCKGTPGRTCMVPDPVDFCIAQDMVALRTDDSKIYNRYLLAVLRSRLIQVQIANTSVGDVIPHFKKQFFDQILIPTPPLELQRKIGDLYFDYSLKIENNKKINQNLEEQIQVILNHSWGNYRFTLNSSEESVLPKKWRYYKLKELCKQIKPGTNYQPRKVTSGIPFLNIRCISQGYIDTSDVKYITEDDYRRVHKKWIPEENDLLLSRIGTLGLVAVIRQEDLPLAVHYNFIDIKSDKLPYEFMYFLLKSDMFQQAYHGIKKQSVQEYVTIDEVENISIPMPEISNYDFSAYKNAFNLLLNNQREMHNLEVIRDTLLPKLMSGESDIFNDALLSAKF